MNVLNFVLSFLRTVTLGGELENCYVSTESTFWKQEWHVVYEDDAYSLY